MSFPGKPLPSLQASEVRRDRVRSLFVIAIIHGALNLLAWVFVLWAIYRVEARNHEYWSIETRRLHIQIQALEKEIELRHSLDETQTTPTPNPEEPPDAE